MRLTFAFFPGSAHVASGQEIGFWRLGRRYMVFPACNSSPGQIHIRSKRHIRGTKPGHNGTCGTDGSTVFSTSGDSFPFKQQGPQPLYPPHGGGDEFISIVRWEFQKGKAEHFWSEVGKTEGGKISEVR